jgi:hypothetical protein
VLLLADTIRFGNPRAKIGVDLTGISKPEGVKMIARRKGLDSAKSRVLETTSEHHVTIQPVLPGRHLRKGHPNLESDSSLLRKDSHGPDITNCCDHLIEECPDLRGLSAKVIRKLVPTAGMRLIAICEIAAAFLAMPQSWLFHRLLSRFHFTGLLRPSPERALPRDIGLPRAPQTM